MNFALTHVMLRSLSNIGSGTRGFQPEFNRLPIRKHKVGVMILEIFKRHTILTFPLHKKAWSRKRAGQFSSYDDTVACSPIPG